MPDKSKADLPTPRRGRATKHSPKKTPHKDYSSLPQKAIKLKSDVTLPPVLKRDAPVPRKEKTKSPAPAKKTNIRKSSRPGDPVDGISLQAREIALAGAAEKGVSLSQWLESLILHAHQAPPTETSEAFNEIRQSLRMIEQRLERIENQKGFWSRFWDQFMEPHRR
jgi:hypothetical protein